MTVTSAENRVSSYETKQSASGVFQFVDTDAAGLKKNASFASDGTQGATFVDGSTLTVAQGPDPRWLMQSPVAPTTSTKMPSGLTNTSAQARSVSLSDPANPFSLTSQTDTFTLNGKTSTTVYAAGTKQYTTTSPSGRVSTMQTDAQGRVTRTEEYSTREFRPVFLEKP